MLKTEFKIDHRFFRNVEQLNYPSALLIEFINEHSNRGNNFIKIAASEISMYLFISESVIYRTLRELEEKKIIKSIIDSKEKFDRVKSYSLDEESLYYLNYTNGAFFEYLDEEQNIKYNDYYTFDHYKENIKYNDLPLLDYLKFLIDTENIEIMEYLEIRRKENESI